MVVLFAAAVVCRLWEEDGRILYKIARAECPNALRVHLHYHCTYSEVLRVRDLGHVTFCRLLETSIIAAGQRQPAVARGEEHLRLPMAALDQPTKAHEASARCNWREWHSRRQPGLRCSCRGGRHTGWSSGGHDTL